MTDPIIQRFYSGKAWRNCRDAYVKSVGGLCERCLAQGLIVPGEEVHHKKRLTPANVGDPSVSLDFANLELLCKECHLQEHLQDRQAVTDQSGHACQRVKDGMPVPMTAHVVAGAPGSGKSHYVSMKAGSKDIIWDMDAVAASISAASLHADHGFMMGLLLAMRDAFIQEVAARAGNWETAWFITSSSSDDQLAYFQRRLSADLIMIPATLDECLEHIDKDNSRLDKARDRSLAIKWFLARGSKRLF